MQLRTGKITGSRQSTIQKSVFDPMAELKKLYEHDVQESESTFDPMAEAMKVYRKQEKKAREEELDKAHKNKVLLLTSLIKSANSGTAIEKMLKISLVYDTILDDAEFRSDPVNACFINVVRNKASDHLNDIESNIIMLHLDTDELVAAQMHFCCTLKKFINGTF